MTIIYPNDQQNGIPTTDCHHHPDISTLMSYAAGSLSDSMSLVVGCHIERCRKCKTDLTSAEQLGSLLLEDSPETPMAFNAREYILRRLDHEFDRQPTTHKSLTKGDLPVALQNLTGKTDIRDLEWRSLAPGMKQILLGSAEGKLRLLKISPGTCMPAHSHSGTELTLVLQGSYSDECGRFQSGDLADLDPDTTHQPVADTDQGCICLIATDAPLKFEGLVPRLLQPFFGL